MTASPLPPKIHSAITLTATSATLPGRWDIVRPALAFALSEEVAELREELQARL